MEKPGRLDTLPSSTPFLNSLPPSLSLSLSRPGGYSANGLPESQAKVDPDPNLQIAPFASRPKMEKQPDALRLLFYKRRPTFHLNVDGLLLP